MEDLLAFRPIGLAIPSDVSTLPAAVACHPRAWLLTETLDEESNILSAIECSERLDRFSDRISTSVGHPRHIFLIVKLVNRCTVHAEVDAIAKARVVELRHAKLEAVAAAVEAASALAGVDQILLDVR